MSTQAFLEELKATFPAALWSTDEAERKHYGQDWTYPERPNPCAVFFPRKKEDVVALVKAAKKHKVAIVPSGGRTGLSGGACALNGEVVLSLTKMNKIGPVDVVSRTVDVEAGAITEAVHEATKPHGLTWPVDFASKGSSTVGGNIATNAGGINVIKYGNTRHWVLGLEVVLASGELLKLNGKLEKNNSGPDLRELFIGSEGILGIIVGATLKLAPLPGEKTTVLIGVSDVSAVHRIFKHGRQSGAHFHAFELFSHSCMEIVSHFSKIPNPLQTPAPWYLLTEWEGESGWFDPVMEMDGFVDGRMAQSSDEAKMIWGFRERIAESISLRANPNKNDISVAVDQVPEFLEAFGKRLPARFPQVDYFLYGHLGDGNLHLNTLPKEGIAAASWKGIQSELNLAVAEITRDFHGSISGEHGVGTIKKPYLEYCLSRGEIELIRGLKGVFDPEGLLNPGKVVDRN
ncbi:MAG TPA: FAD-binding oxidoreductase [Bdellovibrionota bacterium]|jgi:FAD/FMN-containing dehydrogenase